MNAKSETKKENPRMQFNFLSTPTFESWDWRNPITPGIGGSETSHVEMAQRLSSRGHHVRSYAPVKFEGVELDPAGVPWEHSSHADYDNPGVWVVYRNPEVIDYLKPGCPVWLIFQDVEYPTLTKQRAERVDRLVALCQEHADHLKQVYPFAAHKVCISSNGIRSGVIRAARTAGANPERNPKRLMYASSPDRGLFTLIPIFNRLREIVPDAELHVYYGFDNIEKVLDKIPYAKKLRGELIEMMKSPGITWHGRTGQIALIDEWFKSGVWCHPSEFTETSCITCMDAQACGAIPVTTPTWAIRENVQHGVFIEGNPQSDPLTQARYVMELVKLVSDHERQEKIRAEMMPWALRTFDWERFVDQWLGWAAIDLSRYQSGSRPQPECFEVIDGDHREHLEQGSLSLRRAIGTIGYMGGIMSLPEPWSRAFTDLVQFSHESMCVENEHIFVTKPKASLHWVARNELASKMVGDWMLMLDCDVIPEPDTCARMVKIMIDHDLDVLSGMYAFKETGAPLVALWNEEEGKHEAILGWSEKAKLVEYSGGGAGCLLIRKRVFDRIKSELGQEPFDIRHPLGEDFSFYERCRKLGIRCWFAPSIKLGHLDYEPRVVRQFKPELNPQIVTAERKPAEIVDGVFSVAGSPPQNVEPKEQTTWQYS